MVAQQQQGSTNSNNSSSIDCPPACLCQYRPQRWRNLFGPLCFIHSTARCILQQQGISAMVSSLAHEQDTGAVAVDTGRVKRTGNAETSLTARTQAARAAMVPYCPRSQLLSNRSWSRVKQSQANELSVKGKVSRRRPAIRPHVQLMS